MTATLSKRVKGFGRVALFALLLGLNIPACGHSINSTDEAFWHNYASSFAGIDKECLYSEYRDPRAFGELRSEVLTDADRLSAQFDAVHYGLPIDHPLAQRARVALETIKPRLASRQPCKTAGGRDLDRITVHVIAHDVPAAFTFPNGRVYLTTGIIDPTLPWAARTDDELLGVIAHEAIHLVADHVVVHWAVIRQRQAEKIGHLPYLLTWLLPIRIVPGQLPLGAETYDERIEFLADSGAVEILRELDRNPDGYLAFLNRMATYPYFDAIDQSERADLMVARAECLGLCLSPSRAQWRPEAEPPRKLNSHEQFVLCAKSYVTVDQDEWRRLADWLRQPESILLNDVATRTGSQSLRPIVKEFVTEQSKRIGQGKVIARALLGERAQLEAGCPLR